MMDFALDEEKEMLKRSARDFLSKEYPEKLFRQMVKNEKGYSPELLSMMAEMGWTALAIPEEYGGIGDFLDLCVVLEEMGRVCLTGPFFSSVVLGASAIIEAGSHEQKERFLPEIAEGKLIMSLALTESSARYTADAIQSKAREESGSFILQGKKLFVPDAQSCDFLICVARTGDGVTLFLVDSDSPGIEIKPLLTVAGDKQCEVIFNNVSVSQDNVLGEPDNSWQVVAKVIEKAAIARCAEMVGSAERVLEMTLNYARERMAFGHPIGAYQSIQHRCADMLTDVTGSRFVTYQAAWRLKEGLPAKKETAIAKAWVGQACRRVVTSAHQVFGTIGFTEDHVLHLYTRRTRANEFSFGDVDFHLERLAEIIGSK
jgi:alkylation response protein AidB-like acyl-CoA dehydrogenase